MRLFLAVSVVLTLASTACRGRGSDAGDADPAPEEKAEETRSAAEAEPQTPAPTQEKEAERALGPNEWRDPMTNSRWLLTSYTTKCTSQDQRCVNSQDPEKTMCSGNWRYPKGVEIVKAMNAGLTSALPAPHPFYWTFEGYIAGRYEGSFQALNRNINFDPDPLKYSEALIGLYCIYGAAAP